MVQPMVYFLLEISSACLQPLFTGPWLFLATLSYREFKCFICWSRTVGKRQRNNTFNETAQFSWTFSNHFLKSISDLTIYFKEGWEWEYDVCFLWQISVAWRHNIHCTLLSWVRLVYANCKRGALQKESKRTISTLEKIQPLETWACPDGEKIIVSRFDEEFIALTL